MSLFLEVKNIILVAMSLVASFVSGISLIGTSTEIYVYGTQFVFSLVSPFIMAIFMHFVIIPVFYDLNVVSMNEVDFWPTYLRDQTQTLSFQYLQRRFDMRMRLLGSIVQTTSNMFWLPIVIYVPALAFNQTTGIDIHIITPAVTTVCIIYTCLVRNVILCEISAINRPRTPRVELKRSYGRMSFRLCSCTGL